MSDAIQTASPALVPLDEALAPYRGVSVRTARALIASGRLPATKIGRSYLVDPRDVAGLFRPVLRVPAGIHRGEGPTSREDRQLREAGFVPLGGSTHNGGIR